MSDFSDLEAELKQLRPAASSAELVSRVERGLSDAPSSIPTAGVLPRPKARVNWFALGFGVAAAAAFLILARIGVDDRTKPQTLAAFTPAPLSRSVPAPGLVPDGLTRVVYNTRDEGLMFPEKADEPVRRLRSRSRETLQWRDPSNGASLRVSYPTEELEFIPVSGQ